MNPEKLWAEIAEHEQPIEQYHDHIRYMLDELKMTPPEVRDFLNIRGIKAWISDIYRAKNNETQKGLDYDSGNGRKISGAKEVS